VPLNLENCSLDHAAGLHGYPILGTTGMLGMPWRLPARFHIAWRRVDVNLYRPRRLAASLQARCGPVAVTKWAAWLVL
jgi:hypothetical protein